MTAALIVTCYREVAHIDDFLDAVLRQSRQPDEIVIVDAGSDDGTAERIHARGSQIPHLRLIVEPGANRSRGRNLAIGACSADAIAATDVGALPQPDWFRRIIAPLEVRADVDVVAGHYRATASGLWQAAVAAATVPLANEVDPSTFLPSARSVAFRRDVWKRVGGYPERASHNEDTPFGRALRAAGARFAFEPAAVVEWIPHTEARLLLRQFGRYALGDAQEGIWARHYAKAYVLALAAVVLACSGLAWPPALWGLPLLAVAYWSRHAMRAAHRTRLAGVAALAPVANLIVDIAHLCGYTRGIAGRALAAARKEAT